MAKFYKENEVDMGKIQGGAKDAFVQKDPTFEISNDTAPEADFSSKGNRKYEAKGILSILEYIIMDLNDEIKNDMADEEATQLQYEKALAAAQTFHGKMLFLKIDLEDAKGVQEEDLLTEEKKMED